MTEPAATDTKFHLPTVIAVAAVAVALLAAAATAWQWRESQAVVAERAALVEKVTQQETALTALRQAQARAEAAALSADVLQAEVDALRAEFAAEAATAQAEMEALTAAVERLALETQSGRALLLLDEVEHLLRFAARRVALAADPVAAVTALVLAEQRLRASGDAGLVEVRRLVVETLAKLRAAARTDTAALAIEVGALALTVDTLPLAHDFRPQAAVKAVTASPAAGAQNSWWSPARWRAAWDGFVAELGDDLKDLIRIRKHETAPGVLLVPEQRYFLVENIKLLLLGAQQALLRERLEVARQNLARAETLLRDYFYAEDAGVQAAIVALQRIHAAASVKPNYPLPDAALNALREVRAERSGRQ